MMKKQPTKQVLRDYMHEVGGTWSPVRHSLIKRLIETYSEDRNSNGTPFPEDVAEMELMYAVNCQNMLPYRYMAAKWGWGDTRAYNFYVRLGIYQGRSKEVQNSVGTAWGQREVSKMPTKAPKPRRGGGLSSGKESRKTAEGQREGSNVFHKEIQDANRSDAPAPSLCSGTSLDTSQIFSRSDLDVILRWEKSIVEDEEERQGAMPSFDNFGLGAFGPSITSGSASPIPFGLGAFGPSITSKREPCPDNIEQILSGVISIPEVSEEDEGPEEWSHELDTLRVGCADNLGIGSAERVGATPPPSHTLREGVSVRVAAPDIADATSLVPSSDNPVRRLLGASDEELETKIQDVNAILESYGYTGKIEPVDLWHVADKILRIPRDRIDLAISVYKEYHRTERFVGMMPPWQFFTPEQIDKTIRFLNNLDLKEE